MERDDLALDGLLRELARAPEGDDHAFVGRVLARTRKPQSPRSMLVAAAALLLAMAGFYAFAPEAPTGRLELPPPACLMADASRVRILLPEAGRTLLLGDLPIDAAAARVPANVPLLLQTVGRDGMALWTSPRATIVPASPASGGAPVVGRKAATSVDFARDVKPILDQHCAGCHAEAALVRTAVKPFEARRSGLVTQTHAPLSGSERQQLALWVDLGAVGRP